MSTDVEAIKDALHQWVEAINACRADALSNLVSDDVVFLHPPERPFAGRAAVARFYRETFQMYDVKEQFQYKDIRVVGALATARITEHIQLKPRGGGAVVDFTEAEAMRFRRQSEGAWKLVSRSLVAPSPLLLPFGHLAQCPLPSSSNVVCSSAIDFPAARRQEHSTPIPFHPSTAHVLTARQILQEAGLGTALGVTGGFFVRTPRAGGSAGRVERSHVSLHAGAVPPTTAPHVAHVSAGACRVLVPPTSAYLRALTATITSNTQIPRAIRNECHRLLRAIEANDASSIAESVAGIESLAATASVELPGRE